MSITANSQSSLRLVAITRMSNCTVTLHRCTVAILALSAIRAENVDLSTVPRRDTVQLTIYNSEDITLVRETRVVTFKKGANPLQFSWANTLIDPSSVELKFLTSADKLDVLDTTFPHDKPQMLYWNVKSEIDGEATIQITYFTSGITWSADYIAIADKDEGTMNIDGFVRVTNNSGEEYEDAQVRLVVGTINLVEKIAQLANVPMGEVKNLPSEKAQAAFAAKWPCRVDGPRGDWRRDAAPAAAPAKEKEIIKEGLSEYFIYTIEGTETIPNGWSKRMRSFEGNAVPLKIQYRYRPQEYGDQLVRMYLMTNNNESKLGTTPLPDGIVRVFRNNGRDGLSYLTQQSIKYIPIGDKIELNLGADPGSRLRADQAARLARQPLDADQRHETSSKQVGARHDRNRGQLHRRRLGRPQHLPPANPQLHGEADRRRNPPQLRRPHRVPQPARTEAARFPNRPVHNASRARRKERPALRNRATSRPQRQTKQRDARNGGDQT